MSNKKVLIVTSEFPPQPGGIGNHAFYLATYLHKSDYEVSVLCDQRSWQGDQEKNFDKTLPFKITRIKRRRFRSRMYLERVIKLKELINNKDFVLATGKFSLWNVAFSAIEKSKKIAIVHGSEVNLKRKILRQSIDASLKRFSKIVAVSSYTKSLIDHLKLDVHIIPNAIDYKKWQGARAGEENLKGRPSLITVGRISERKGQQLVLEHLPQLIADFPEVHYHCVGLNSGNLNLMEKAMDLKVEDHLTVHGRLADEDLKNMLLGADIFVMLSKETAAGDTEGFGIALLEANATGTPTIGSKGCGIEDAILNEKSGYLIDPNNSDELVNAVKKLLQNEQLFKNEAMKFARNHDWSLKIDAYKKLMQ